MELSRSMEGELSLLVSLELYIFLVYCLQGCEAFKAFHASSFFQHGGKIKHGGILNMEEDSCFGFCRKIFCETLLVQLDASFDSGPSSHICSDSLSSKKHMFVLIVINYCRSKAIDK